MSTIADGEQVVFIDSDVPDIQGLIAGLAPGVRAFVLDPSSDGVQQIANILAANDLTDLSSISIVGHGAAGEIQLGSTVLDTGDLSSESAALAQIGAALAPGGDIQLYACDVARAAAGQQFIADLSQYIGDAAIAASSNLVGAAAEGGSWNLNVDVGAADVASPFTAAAAAAYSDVLSLTSNQIIFNVWNGAAGPEGAGNRVEQFGVSGSSAGSTVDLADGTQSGDSNVLDYTTGVAVDTALNEYFVASYNPIAYTWTIQEGAVSGGNLTTLYTVPFPALNANFTPTGQPITGTAVVLGGFALDAATGELYFAQDAENYQTGDTVAADTGIYKISLSGGSATLVTSPSAGLVNPDYMALDASANLLFFDDSIEAGDGFPATDNLDVANLTTGTVTVLKSFFSTSDSVDLLQGLALNGNTLYLTTVDHADSTSASNAILSIPFTVSGSGSTATASVGATTTLYSGSGADQPSDIVIDAANDLFYTAGEETATVDSSSGNVATVFEGSLSGGTALTPVLSMTDVTGAVTATSSPAFDTYDPQLVLLTQPVVTAGGAVTAVPGGSAVTVDSGVTVSDEDGQNLAGATITGALTGDTLSFNGGSPYTFGDGDQISGSFSGGVLTLSGDATAADYQTALDSVTFVTTSTNTTARTIGWAATDGVVASATADSTVDEVLEPPADVTSVTVPSDGTYGPGEVLTFTVNFSENVLVTTGGGTPYISVTLDTGGTEATYTGGSGSSALTFAFTVVAGNDDTNGIVIGSAITLNGGTIKNEAANAAVLTLNDVAQTTGVLIDTIPPTVSSIDIAGSSPNSASSDAFTVSFSTAVNGVDATDFTLHETGTVAGAIASVSGGGTTYTVTVTGVTGDGTLRLDLNNIGDPITDNFGNMLTAAHTGDESYAIDTTPPSLSLSGASSDAVEGGPAVTALASASISDPDGPGALIGATVEITNAQAGDELSIPGISGGTLDGGAITVTGNNTSSLTLSGSDSVAEYQTLLGEVTYQDAGSDTTTAGYPARTLDWTVSNALLTSQTAQTTLTIDRTPVIALSPTSVNYLPGESATPLQTAVSLTDLDGADPLASATVTISAGTFAGDGDELTYNGAALTTTPTQETVGADTFNLTYDASSEQLAIATTSATGSLSDYQTLLDNVDFRSSAADPGNGGVDQSRTVSFVATDTLGATSAIVSETIAIAPAAPAITTLVNATGTGVDDTNHSKVEIAGTGENGDTINLYADGDTAAPVGTGTVTGGSFEIIASSLPDGMHSFEATETDTAGLTSALSSGFAVTIDTTAPTVAFNATPTAFDGAEATVFSGTASDSGSGVAEVQIYEGAIKLADLLGAASLVGDAWSLSTTLAAGLYNQLQVVATDGAGNTATAAAPYTLRTGITGQAYTALEDNYVGGALASLTYFNSGGSTYLAGAVAPGGSGGTDYTFTSGSYFTGKPYGSFEEDFNSSGALTSQTYFLGDGGSGPTYLVDTVAPGGSGGTDYTYTSGSYFTGKPYGSLEYDLNSSGALTSQTYFLGDGGSGPTYLADTVAPDGSGGTDYTFTSGSYFTGKPYGSFEEDFNSSGALTSQTYFLDDGGSGPTYLADTVAPGGSGGTDYTYTSGSYFTGKPYGSLEDDFSSSGALTGQTYFLGDGGSGPTYLVDTVAPGGSGGTDYTYTSGSYFTGKPYGSLEYDLNSSGALTSQTYFLGDGGSGPTYLADTVAPDGTGGTDYTYTSGSYFTGKLYSSYEDDDNSSGALAEQIFHNKDGSQTIEGFVGGLTLTGGQDDTTFLFHGGFGEETVADLATYLTGPTHDTISIPSFASFSDLLAATQNNGQSEAVITVSPGNTVTLTGVDKAMVQANPMDFIPSA